VPAPPSFSDGSHRARDEPFPSAGRWRRPRTRQPSLAVTNGRSPVQASLRRPLRRTEPGHRAVPLPQPSPAGAGSPRGGWFQQGRMDDWLRRRPPIAGARLDLPGTYPACPPLWFHAPCSSGSMPPRGIWCCTTPPELRRPHTALDPSPDRSRPPPPGLPGFGIYACSERLAEVGPTIRAPSARGKCASQPARSFISAVWRRKHQALAADPELSGARALRSRRGRPAGLPRIRQRLGGRLSASAAAPLLLPLDPTAAPGHRGGGWPGWRLKIRAWAFAEALAASTPAPKPAGIPPKRRGGIQPPSLAGRGAHVGARAVSVAVAARKSAVAPSIPAYECLRQRQLLKLRDHPNAVLHPGSSSGLGCVIQSYTR